MPMREDIRSRKPESAGLLTAPYVMTSVLYVRNFPNVGIFILVFFKQ